MKMPFKTAPAQLADSAPGRPDDLTFVDGLKEGWAKGWLQPLLLVAATLIAYAPCYRGEFVWDDASWTGDLQPLFGSLSGLWTMWWRATALQQYYPLTGTTFWIDYQLWGFNSLPYHLENVFLHMGSVLLFWRILKRLEVPGALLAAALLALHPLMVESVAWITERKNVLSLVLFLAAFWSYGRFTNFWSDAAPESPGPVGSGATAERKWLFYMAAFVLFFAAYLAKATVFAFPAVLLLVCWWKRGRLRLPQDVLPTIPFFLVTLIFGGLVAWLERNHVGAQGPEWALSFPQRCIIAGHAVWFYLGKLLWPATLSFVYPRWEINAHSAAQWLWPGGAVAALIALWFLRNRTGRGPLAAGLFFVGVLFPLLGFLNSFFMRYTFVSDHWCYLPSLGVFALLGALFWKLGATLIRKPLRIPAALFLVFCLGVLTLQQSAVYKNDENLWRDTVAKNPRCWLGLNSLGFYEQSRGNLEKAVQYYSSSVEIHPNCEALYNLGKALAYQGRADASVAAYKKALDLRPDLVVAHVDLGIVLLQKRQPDAALEHLRKAVELNPRSAYARYSLAATLHGLRRAREAAAQYREVLKCEPDHVQALDNLATILASDADLGLRNGAEAVQLAERACQLTQNQDVGCVSTLGMAYAEAGRFDEALATGLKAVQLAQAAGDTAGVKANQALLELYKSRKPYHDADASKQQ